MIKIIITGSKGKMGSRVAAMIKEQPDLLLAAGVDMCESLEKVIAKGDVVIDFTIAAAAAENAAIAAKIGKPIIICTTGTNDSQNAVIAKASKTIPIVHSPNMSIGVNVMFNLIEQAAKSLGSGYSIKIEETHHIHKKDKPSGTAKTMAERAAKGCGCNADSISVQSFREGEVVGDHSITFTGPCESLTIEHHAESRDLFAQGAIAAARWIVGRRAGLYTMEDVLGLNCSLNK